MRILVAEDERELARVITVILERANFSVDIVLRGDDALSYLSADNYDGAVLDIMMPGLSGMDVLKELRAGGSKLPVLMLTAKSQVDDRVAGLDAGANDYLCKPFSAKELVARVRAMLRSAQSDGQAALALGDITLDRQTFVLAGPAGEAILPGKEFQMMEMLMVHPGRRIPTERFLSTIWGYDADVEVSIVWVYVSSLRKRLKAVGSNVQLTALRNAGYALEAAS